MKMTKKEAYNLLLTLTEVNEYPEVISILRNEIKALDKKVESAKIRRTTNSTPKQKENLALCESILNFLTYHAKEPMTAKAIGEAMEITSQKASAMLKKLIEAGDVTKTSDKGGRSLFTAIAAKGGTSEDTKEAEPENNETTKANEEAGAIRDTEELETNGELEENETNEEEENNETVEETEENDSVE